MSRNGFASVVTIALAVVFFATGQGVADDGSKGISHLLDTTGISRGVCSVLGCDDGKVALELARTGRFFVHVQDADKSAVAATRKLVDAEGLYGGRIVVETGSLKRLPYADHAIDLIVATNLSGPALGQLSLSEVLRVLRPHGKAVLGCRKELLEGGNVLTAQQLKDWLQKGGGKGAAVSENECGLWAAVTKPPLEGVDSWSHWEHGPDNNPVSNDAVIKAPYMTQWLGKPYYIAMPAITTAAGGRIFIAMGHIAHHKREEAWLNTLYARNGYNGADLWTVKLPDGYLAHRSAFIATEDTFYMIDMDGNGCLLLDPETGQEKGRISLAEFPGDWKWMAIQDGVLYALVGRQKDPPETTSVRSKYSHWSWGELSKGYYQKRVPWGFGTTLLAYDMKAEKVRWAHKENAPIDSRSLVVGGGRVFFFAPDAHIGCLDAGTGQMAWSSSDPTIRELIREPGRGLSSTPGFRTMCYALYTPKALFYEAQTRMNIVGISTEDGRLLWHRRKTTNNPNMIHVNGKLLVGIGKDGNTLEVDPMTGETLEDLKFKKRSCARLTATSDSFFCRGWPEGLTRYDRNAKKVLFNGAFRPSCNDGVVPANGMLYLGPWACDCNLSLMGRVALCSAGNFDFNHKATDGEHLEVGDGDISRVAPFDIAAKDWATYRANNARSAGTEAAVPKEVTRLWEFAPEHGNKPTTATAAGGLIFLGGSDGKVRAIDAATGLLKWCYLTAGPIVQPPAIWNGRAYVGSGDGYVYALEAATGRLLWRFRAAPVERRIMVYGSLCSTWPVNSGVLVADGVAYAAAGIIDYDGTYVYALDAITGKLKWQNNSSGHLHKDLRKGASAQGILTIGQGRLWLAAGNVVSPAAYDLKTGEYVGRPPGNGSPKTNRGEEVGLFQDKYVTLGGRLRFSAGKNVVNPGKFEAVEIRPGKGTGKSMPLKQGKIPPAWNAERTVFVEGLRTMPVCCESGKVLAYLEKGNAKRPPARQWSGQAPKESDTVALALASNAAVGVCETPIFRQLKTMWAVYALDSQSGSQLWRHNLPADALAGGLLIDRDGRVIVVLEDGRVVCFGGGQALRASIEHINQIAQQGADGRRDAIRTLNNMLRTMHTPADRMLIVASLKDLGVDVSHPAKTAGCVTHWKLIGPVPWDDDKNGVDKAFIGEPDVKPGSTYKIGNQVLKWRDHVTHDQNGMVNLVNVFGSHADVAAYAYAEVDLPRGGDLLLKVGTNDGHKCWFNGKEVGRFDGGRSYLPDQDTLKVKAIKGRNKILLKVTQMGGAWALGVRLTDPKGKPIDLTRASI